MADSGYGVYVSIRNTDGGLFSSSRATWAEIEADLQEAFGGEFAPALTASLRGGVVKAEAVATVVQLPVPSPMPSEAQAMAAAEAILAPAAPVVQTVEQAGQAEQAGQFEPCEKCGAPKDQWKPPGVSKAGKKYPGFFGCPNWRNH